jgi:predicted outer membrane repeat protein
MGDRLFEIVNVHTPVIIEGLRLTGGETPLVGGAVSIIDSNAVSLRQLEIHGNTVSSGGGAIYAGSSTVLIEDSDLHGNHSTSNGEGAAIHSHASFLEIRRTSIHANTHGGVGVDQEALHASGDGSTLLQNSTFSGNDGTALRIVDGDLELNNVTLVGNGRRGVEFERLTGRNLLIRNSVLTANGLGACSLTGAGSAGLATDGHNLTQGTGCDLHAGATNIVNAGPVLGPLVTSPAEFTAYHVPLAGSVLRDSGHPDVSALGCTATDQRGASRPVDGDGNGIARCDIGAIEAATATNELFRNGFE